MRYLLLGLIFAAGCSAQAEQRPPRNGYVLVFSAKWCGPCREYAPTVQKLRTKGYDIRVVDTDTPEGRRLANAYSVDSLPTTVFVRHGREVRREHGPLTEGYILTTLKALRLLIRLLI